MDDWQTYKTNRWFLGLIKQMRMMMRMRKSREKEPKEEEEEDCPTGVSSTIL